MKAVASNTRAQCLICVILSLITLMLYLPALCHGFVDYDDQQYVTDNPRVKAGLTWAGLVWAFGFHAGNWHPLAWLSHMLDCQFYGAYAGGHHLTNVLLHIASTVLLFLILNRMTAAVWRSAAVAALFAWHPLHVESVAWVAERKDVLCAFFWMVTLWFYIRHAVRPSVFRYLITLATFAGCLMAKPMGVTLPFVMLLLDYWPLRRVSGINPQMTSALLPSDGKTSIPFFPQRPWRQVILEKIPFFVFSAIACVLTLKAQQLAIVSTAGLPVSQRFAHVLVAYLHYVIAMFFPHNLAVYYPYQFHVPLTTIACAFFLLGAITLLAIKNLLKRPYFMTGWLWYLGTLVPVIGLVQVGDQAWADRYTYLPLIGLFIIVVWAVGEVVRNRLVLLGVSAIAAVALFVMTSVQLRYWQNTRTLFEHANAVTRNNSLAVTILGSLLAKEGKLTEAMEYYRTALRYTPHFPEAHFFMGNALDEQGKLDEAVAEYKQALWFQPMQEQTHIFLAIALAKQKKYEEAIRHYQAALKLDPDSAVAYNNLARLYHTLGQFDLAVENYQAALRIDPKLAIAHNNLGILLIQQGDFKAGTQHLREALRLKPGNAETKFNLAQALSQQDQWSEAAALFAETIHVHANDPKAHYDFAVVLNHLQRTREAMSQYATALLIQPDFPDALDGLAWILATDVHPEFRNGTEAVKMAERACELTDRQNPEKLKTLAAAYAETGRFAEAISVLQKAQALVVKTNDSKAGEYPLMLERFQHSESWRGP